MSTSARTLVPARWSTPGPPSAPAPRSAGNVHLSGGVGIGGVLEPLQASPTIIEDDCFIGARSEIVEGVIVEAGIGDLDGRVHRPEHAHLRPQQRHRCHAGARTRRARSWFPVRCPRRTVRYGLYCAVIVKRVDAQTRAKTSLNELLRAADWCAAAGLAVAAGDVVFGRLLAGVGEYPRGLVELDQLAQAEEGREIRDARRLLHVVRHDDIV